jgi:hypothetical protein
MKLTFTDSANRKLAQRNISIAEVESVVATGRILREYPDDRPFPSRLVLGWVGARPLHVVYGVTPEGEGIVITGYQPDPAIWNEDFTTKRGASR